MNTRFVEAFLWVAKLGSFRAAAERLHVTQAAVSNRIASLEEDIGARLFERDTRDLRLTPVGVRLLDYGERLLELQRAIVALGRPGKELLGLVRIGAIESVVHTWLVDFLGVLQCQHPGIEVQLTSETTHALHERLQAGTIDIALQTDALAEPGFVSLDCSPMVMGWVGSGQQPAAHRTGAGSDDPDTDQASISDLLQHPVLTMSPGSQPHQAMKQLFRHLGRPVGQVHCVSSMAALMRLVKSGFGNALLPLPPVREEIERGDLRIIRCDVPLPSQRIVVSFVEATESPAIRFVAELARTESHRFASQLSAPFAAAAPV